MATDNSKVMIQTRVDEAVALELDILARVARVGSRQRLIEELLTIAIPIYKQSLNLEGLPRTSDETELAKTVVDAITQARE